MTSLHSPADGILHAVVLLHLFTQSIFGFVHFLLIIYPFSEPRTISESFSRHKKRLAVSLSSGWHHDMRNNSPVLNPHTSQMHHSSHICMSFIMFARVKKIRTWLKIIVHGLVLFVLIDRRCLLGFSRDAKGCSSCATSFVRTPTWKRLFLNTPQEELAISRNKWLFF